MHLEAEALLDRARQFQGRAAADREAHRVVAHWFGIARGENGEDGAHKGTACRAERLGVLEERRRRELPTQTERRTDRQRGHDGIGLRIGVIERQIDEDAVGGGQFEDARRLHAGRGITAMRAHHALGAARRAGRVENRTDVMRRDGLDLDLQARIQLREKSVIVDCDERKLRAALPKICTLGAQPFVVCDDQARVRLADQIINAVAEQLVVEADGNRADHIDAEPSHQKRRAVAGDERDVIAFTDALFAQLRAEFAGQRIDLAIAERRSNVTTKGLSGVLSAQCARRSRIIIRPRSSAHAWPARSSALPTNRRRSHRSWHRADSG